MNYSLFYAKDQERNLVYIENVEAGLSCNCYCPYCDEKLIAKNQGQVREHHFAHYSNKECVHGYETSLHLLAKEIFEESMTVLIPGTDFAVGNKQYIDDTLADVQSVELERKVGTIIPDITILLSSNEIVYIEIKVTHAVDSDKYDKIRELGLNVIEIDISEIDYSISKEELKEILFDKSYMKWVNNAKYNHYKDLLLDLVNVKEARLNKDSYIIDFCPCNNGQVDIDNTCDKCEYHLKMNSTSLLDCLKINCLGDFEMRFPLDDIKSIQKRKNHRLIKLKNEEHDVVYFDKKKPDSIYNIWKRFGLTCGGFVKNIQEGYGLYISTPPLKQYYKYNGKIYGKLYKRGKLIDSRQIFYTNDKQWIFVGDNDIQE